MKILIDKEKLKRIIKENLDNFFFDENMRMGCLRNIMEYLRSHEIESKDKRFEELEKKINNLIKIYDEAHMFSANGLDNLILKIRKLENEKIKK